MPRTSLPPAPLNPRGRGGQRSGSPPPRSQPPPHPGPRWTAGDAVLRPGRGGAKRGELFPAGSERRPAEPGPFPPAPVGKHLLPGALVGAQPAGPRRQPRSSPSPAPKPFGGGNEALLPPNLRGSGGPAGRPATLPGGPAGVRSQREASLPASPEAAAE